MRGWIGAKLLGFLLFAAMFALFVSLTGKLSLTLAIIVGIVLVVIYFKITTAIDKALIQRDSDTEDK